MVRTVLNIHTRFADAEIRNGPAGVFEFENFAKGSKATLDACIDAASNGSTVIIGSYSSRAMSVQLTVRIQAVEIPLLSSLVSLWLVVGEIHADRSMIDYKSEDKLSHVSTGGG